MEYILFISFALSFIVTFLLTPIWIRAAHRIKITGKDMNKYDKPKVAEMGGLTVNAGFFAGVLAYVGLSTFYFKQSAYLIYILAVMSTCLIIMVIGMLDDILGWKIGLKQWQKPLLTSLAALPMMAVNAGHSEMIVPIFGSIDFGILYPLIIVPLAITGAANGFNMLAGYNGLEAGMGVLLLGTLGFVAWQTGSSWVAMLALSMVFALLAFLKYNWYPAKIFPGDSFTYSVGALIACVAILGNMEKIAVVLFIPYFLDFLLPLRSGFKTEAFARVNKDRSLEMPYGGGYKEIYDVTHFAIFILKKIKKVYEKDVVISIMTAESIIIIFVLFWVF